MRKAGGKDGCNQQVASRLLPVPRMLWKPFEGQPRNRKGGGMTELMRFIVSMGYESRRLGRTRDI
jgi:hypothetical protein